MIDVNGKKIRPQNDTADLPFLLKEIQFFRKAFQKNPSDPQALVIATRIHRYLQAKGNTPSIADTLEILEEYSTRSDSYDFLWELIYIRRILAEQTGLGLSGKKEKAMHNQKEAEFFRTIARIRPTPYNRCAEVIEWVTTAIYYKEAKDQEMVDTLLTRARSLYEAIDEVKTEKYYTAGKYLYLEILLSKSGLNTNRGEKYVVYQQLIKSVRGLYGIKPSNELLSLLAGAYIDLFSFEQFSYAKEKAAINDALALLDSAIAEGATALERKRDLLRQKTVNAEQN